MISLLRSEIKRLLSRRMTLAFPGVLMLLILGGAVIAYFVITNDDESSVDFVNDLAGGVDAELFFQPIAFVVPLMAFVIGASSIGADLKTGMVEQILTWEPRRLRFLFARCVANFVGVTLAAAAVAAVFTALMFGLSALAGTTDGVTGELWANIGVSIVRMGIAGGLFSIFGVGVALLVNSSVGAIVGFAIYFFIIENIVAAFLPTIASYLPIANTSAFASGTNVERIDGNAFSGDFDLIVSHGYLTAGLILAGWTILAAALAGVIFTRRDVA